MSLFLPSVYFCPFGYFKFIININLPSIINEKNPVITRMKNLCLSFIGAFPLIDKSSIFPVGWRYTILERFQCEGLFPSFYPIWIVFMHKHRCRTGTKILKSWFAVSWWSGENFQPLRMRTKPSHLNANDTPVSVARSYPPPRSIARWKNWFKSNGIFQPGKESQSFENPAWN